MFALQVHLYKVFREMHHKKVIKGKVIVKLIFFHFLKNEPKLSDGFTRKLLNLQKLLIETNLWKMLYKIFLISIHNPVKSVV